jgi:hypothetical protein
LSCLAYILAQFLRRGTKTAVSADKNQDETTSSYRRELYLQEALIKYLLQPRH